MTNSVQLAVHESLDAGKYHVRDSEGHEVARVEMDGDRQVVVLYGALLDKEQIVASYEAAFTWIKWHGAQIVGGG